MRTHLSLLLAIMLSLNASYVASVGICSALEQATYHEDHFGHHNHLHGDDLNHDEHAQDKPPLNGEVEGITAAANDHHHHHVHPNFSSILPDNIGVTPLIGASPLVETPPLTYSSVSHALLDRPPRTSIA